MSSDSVSNSLGGGGFGFESRIWSRNDDESHKCNQKSSEK